MCHQPLMPPLSSPSAKLMIMALEEYGYQSRRGIKVKRGFQPERLAQGLKQWVWKSVRYGVSKGLDTVYWGFLGVGTMLDIFHNIKFIPYFQYGVLILFPLWSLVSAGTDTPYLP
ncbi:hypothetical protein Tco_0646966 [Tanacetum coccineum]